ncbi:MAG: hypothetical protein AAF196_13650 [Planctomycetota bacterium]
MKLAFLDLFEVEGGAVRGAALVTDERTRPLEFRLTDPVRMSSIERKLCGSVANEHLAGDLCGGPLLDALRETPDCVLVRDESLVSLQDRRRAPVLWIGPGETVHNEDGEVVAAGPMIGFDGDSQLLSDAKAALGRIARSYDLLEPFERMMEAVEEVVREGLAQPN